jgi:hypothetical protein
MHGSLGVIVSPEMSTSIIGEFLRISSKVFVENKVFIVTLEDDSIRFGMTITVERVISLVPIPHLHFVV